MKELPVVGLALREWGRSVGYRTNRTYHYIEKSTFTLDLITHCPKSNQELEITHEMEISPDGSKLTCFSLYRRNIARTVDGSRHITLSQCQFEMESLDSPDFLIKLEAKLKMTEEQLRKEAEAEGLL